MKDKTRFCASFGSITRKLKTRLKVLFDDEEFIEGILVYADNAEDRLILLEYIETGVDVSVETVTVLALDLNDERETHENYTMQ